ncbi:MAG: AhpC/TSA family protein [Chlorobi bacterium]|nr:AhpC/TSA family protein [Chlorobiota bacterium]
MKNLFFAAIFVSSLFFISSCDNAGKNNYTVTFDIKGIKDGWLIMQQRKDGNWIKIDSVELKNGTAVIKGNLESPEFYYVTMKNSRNFMPLFIEPGNIKVTANAQTFSRPKVEGSQSQTVYESFLDKMDEYDQKASDLGKQYQEAKKNDDEALAQKISDEYDKMSGEKADDIIDFAIKNNKSIVAPFVMVNYSYLFELEDLKKVNDTLDASLSESYYANSLNDRVKILENVQIGKPFVDFTLNDPDGNPVALSSIAGKGNYVLVDFWAAWCRPCRAENPNVVKNFNKYHDKGFTVFGVSFDKDHDKWVKAIEDDSLTWTQVSDLKYWGSEAGKLYGVQSIPHNVLIDPDGIIIAKDLRGEKLGEKLEELYK